MTILNFRGIHIMIDELMNKIGSKKIRTYMEEQKVVLLIKNADDLTKKIEKTI